MNSEKILNSPEAITWARFCVAHKKRTGKSPIEISGSHLALAYSKILEDEFINGLERELEKIDNPRSTENNNTTNT